MRRDDLAAALTSRRASVINSKEMSVEYLKLERLLPSRMFSIVGGKRRPEL